MKALFLDCDGVINSEEWFTQHAASTAASGWLGLTSIDTTALARVKAAVAATGATIVLSSTWRLVPEYIAELRKAGLVIADCTPRLSTNHRGDEILAWLEAHPEVTNFAILDDDEDAGDGSGLKDRFIQTTWQRGIQDEHVAAIIALLGRKGPS